MKITSDDIVVWSDGTWCYGDELSQMTHMSDDYELLVYWSEPWQKFSEENI